MNHKQRVNIIIAIICFLLFFFITGLILTNHIQTLDEIIYQFIIQFRNSNRDWFFTHFTHVVDTIPVIIVTIILLLLLKNKKDKRLFFSSFVLTTGMNQLLKHVIKRSRPPLDRRLIVQKGFSYPSGHTMVSVCIYGILLYFVLTRIKNRALKWILSVFLIMMILLIGISRIYVGVHYPSDVIGGLLLTISILIVNGTLMSSYTKGE